MEQTHGAQIEWRGEDGFKRTVVVAKFDDGEDRIKWETWGEGDEKPPLTKAIALTTEAFEIAVSFFIDFSMNMSAFKVEPSNVHEVRGEPLGESSVTK